MAASRVDRSLLIRSQELAEPAGGVGTPFDHYNTVEMVDLPAVPKGSYRIVVFAYDTPRRTQGYALTVVGHLGGELTEAP